MGIQLPKMIHYREAKYDKHDPGAYVPIDDIDCELFLDNLRKCGIPSHAARACGRGETAFQLERSKNPAFSEAWDWAMRESYLALEAEARRRAVQGVRKPIYYKDEIIDEIVEYSDSLLALLLKANHPAFGGVMDETKSQGAGPVGTININSVPSGQFLDLTVVDPDGEL